MFGSMSTNLDSPNILQTGSQHCTRMLVLTGKPNVMSDTKVKIKHTNNDRDNKRHIKMMLLEVRSHMYQTFPSIFFK